VPGRALIAQLRALFRAVVHRDDVESDIQAEFQHHIEMRTADLVRTGLSDDEASHRARREFGHIDTHRADARVARGFSLLDPIRYSWLDMKLALRMLVKNPLLSLAAVFALAVGIPVGIAPTHLAKAVEAPLPGDTENRVRAIRLWNPATSDVDATGYQAFTFWKATLRSFSTMAAFRTSSYNVASEDGRAASVPGAELSPEAFSILRAAPRLGRALAETDAEPAAPAVVVLGHNLWKSRFGSDSLIIGRSIRIGREMRTVVGVMPAGFRFPAKEQLWLPLPSQWAGVVGALAPVRIIGRLADGISAEEAQAELTARRLPLFANEPESRARLRPEVVPFGLLYLGLPRGGLDAMLEYRFVQLLSLILLLVACGNVAMLVFARTATRFREMAIRTALGASRARIVSQIFLETVVLAVVAAAVGVLSIGWVLRHVNLAAIAGESALPYWLSLDVTAGDLLRALLFAAISATVAGVVPAIRITGKAVHQHMRGASGVRFGRLTGALVVADIAVSVAAVGFALAIADQATVGESDQFAGVPAAEYLAVQLRVPDDGLRNGGPTGRDNLIERTAAAQRALVASLSAEPGIAGVAVGSALPRMEHQSAPFEVDGVDRSPDAPQQWVRTARVDIGFFEALGHQVIAGRDFTSADLEPDRRTAIVNTAFVTRVLEGKNLIGRRVRFPTRKGIDSAWYEIVGVVGNLGVNMVSRNAETGAAVYFPASPGSINPLWIGIHANVAPLSLAPRVREIAGKVAPDFVMGELTVLSEVHQGDWYLVVGVAAGLMVLVGVLVALAASGIYAMLSLSVSERTREIGIRTALGAQRHAVVLMILKRSLVQIGIGAILGLPLSARVVHLTVGATAGQSPLMSVLLAMGMAASLVLIVGVIACTIPTRRILAVEASEAMRSDG
jgi:putative ABC transport system permease protein